MTQTRCKAHGRVDCSTCRNPRPATGGTTYDPAVHTVVVDYGSSYASSDPGPSSCDSGSSGGGDC